MRNSREFVKFDCVCTWPIACAVLGLLASSCLGFNAPGTGVAAEPAPADARSACLDVAV